MLKKFKRVVLHFGADKTGSTAIQKAFDLTRQPLLESGVLAYPPGQWHAQLGSFFCDDPLRYIYNAQVGITDIDSIRASDNRYFQELERWLHNAPTCESVLFSYEGFVDLDELALKKLKTYSERLADSVSVLLYVRPPLAYAVSAMSQRIKQGILAWPVGNPPISHYETFLRKITAVFDQENTHVRNFTPGSLKNGDVVEDFCEVLGIPAKLVEKIQANAVVANESLSWPALRFGEILKNAFAVKDLVFSEGEFYDKFGQYLVAIPGNKIQLTTVQIDALLIASKPHSDYLKQHFEIVFNEDVQKSLHPQNDESAGQEELMQAFGRIFANTVGHYRQSRSEFSEIEFLLLRVESESSKNVQNGQSITFVLDFSLAINVAELEIRVNVLDKDGRWILGADITLLDRPLLRVARGCHKIRYHMVADLPEGQYNAGFTFAERRAGGNRELARYDKLVTFAVAAPSEGSGVDHVNPPASFDHQQTSDIVISLIEDAKGTISCDGVLGSVGAGESFWLPVKLKNTSTQAWVSTWHHPINFSYHWLNDAGDIVVSEGDRTPLPVDKVSSGQTITSSMRVTAPTAAGRYKLLLVPVQEKWCWFEKKGFIPGVLELSVVSPGNAQHYAAADMRLTSKTGRREGLAMVSTGQAGFLLYGPYAKLPAGRYVARLKGQCEPDAMGGWLDACSDKGVKVLARLELQNSVKPGCIAELAFELAEPVNDLEVRLWVPAEVSMRVESLSIEPDVEEANVAEPVTAAQATEEQPERPAKKEPVGKVASHKTEQKIPRKPRTPKP